MEPPANPGRFSALAEAVSYCCEHDRYVIGNDWASVASTSPPPDIEVERVRKKLEAAGSTEWLAEEELNRPGFAGGSIP